MTTHKKATGIATGKIILIGEHSVVYNKAAIAIPCTAVMATTTVSSADKGISIQSDLYHGLITDMPDFLKGVKVVIEATLSFLKQTNTALHLTINSTIPLERGMGSSAAISISIIKALFNYFNATPTPQELFTLSELSEKIMHGNPSGLDATTIINQQAVLFQKEHPVQPFAFHTGAFLIIADSGVTGQTKVAVQKVAKLKIENPIKHHQLIDELGKLTIQTKLALANSNLNLLGTIFNQAHILLQQLGVSHNTVDHLVTVALKNKALGAKMTGGGLGGCLFALANTHEAAEKISKALLQAGAKQTFIQAI